MSNLLTYGSLRRGQFNFNAFGPQRYVRSLVLNGWRMYSLIAYPVIVPADAARTICTELHQIDEETARVIQYVELNAGYQETIVDLPDGVRAHLYYADVNRIRAGTPIVESGDWAARTLSS